MLDTYKFKFKYANGGMKVSGNGSVKAECIDDAIFEAQNGVAKDLKGNADNVAITSISKVKAKSRKKSTAKSY